jgi:hypothetical protein
MMFVAERVFEPGDEIGMGAARVLKLCGVDRDGAMLAGMVHAQDAADEAGGHYWSQPTKRT